MLAVASDANLGAATAPLVLDGGTLRFDASFNPAATRPVGARQPRRHDRYQRQHRHLRARHRRHRRAHQDRHRHAHPRPAPTPIPAAPPSPPEPSRSAMAATTGSLTGNIVDNASLVINRSNTAHLRRHDQRQRIARPRPAPAPPSSPAPTATPAAPSSAPAPCRSAMAAPPAASTGDVVNNGTLAFDRADTLTFGGTISGTGAVLQAGTGTTDPHRRQQLYRRNHDRCRHPADRRRRDHRQRGRQCRQQWRAGVQPVGRGHLRRRGQRHRHARPDRSEHPDAVGEQYPYRRDQRQRRNARGRERSQSRRRQRRAHARWRPPADHAPRSPARGPSRWPPAAARSTMAASPTCFPARSPARAR